MCKVQLQLNVNNSWVPCSEKNLKVRDVFRKVKDDVVVEICRVTDVDSEGKLVTTVLSSKK